MEELHQDHDVFEAMIQIFADDDISVIAGVTTALAEMRVSILQINTRKHGEDDVIINVKFTCRDTGHFHSVVSKLKTVPHVNTVVRGFN